MVVPEEYIHPKLNVDTQWKKDVINQWKTSLNEGDATKCIRYTIMRLLLGQHKQVWLSIMQEALPLLMFRPMDIALFLKYHVRLQPYLKISPKQTPWNFQVLRDIILDSILLICALKKAKQGSKLTGRDLLPIQCKVKPPKMNPEMMSNDASKIITTISNPYIQRVLQEITIALSGDGKNIQVNKLGHWLLWLAIWRCREDCEEGDKLWQGIRELGHLRTESGTLQRILFDLALNSWAITRNIPLRKLMAKIIFTILVNPYGGVDALNVRVSDWNLDWLIVRRKIILESNLHFASVFKEFFNE